MGGESSPAGSHPTSSSKSTISKTPSCTIALLTLSFTITYTRVLTTSQSLFKAFTRCCSGFCSRRGQRSPPKPGLLCPQETEDITARMVGTPERATHITDGDLKQCFHRPKIDSMNFLILLRNWAFATLGQARMSQNERGVTVPGCLGYSYHGLKWPLCCEDPVWGPHTTPPRPPPPSCAFRRPQHALSNTCLAKVFAPVTQKLY